MTQNLYYLASPYSAKEEDADRIQHERFLSVCEATAALKRLGLLIFSPIAHSHPVAAFGLPGDFAWWQAYDERMMDACDSIIVLMLDGWKESKGVQSEIKYMQEKGKPVCYIGMDEIGRFPDES